MIEISKFYNVRFQTIKPAFTASIIVEANNKCQAKDLAIEKFNASKNLGKSDSECYITVKILKWKFTILQKYRITIENQRYNTSIKSIMEKLK